ncbi:unnamed protein product [Spirodela intermedia]|uniref:Uncharacterized protein n=1 Tax=Spirodela intermedia TaxID=51605 RepID=A0A7I8JVT1_SPIIN|nr:unnamed protein product [Spirodela intermedia]
MMYDRPYESFVRLFLACEARNATKSAEGTIRARLYHNPRQLESHPEKLGELPMPATPVFASTAGTTAKGLNRTSSSKLLIWRSGEASQGAQIRGGFSDNHTQSPNRRKRQMIRGSGQWRMKAGEYSSSAGIPRDPRAPRACFQASLSLSLCPTSPPAETVRSSFLVLGSSDRERLQNRDWRVPHTVTPTSSPASMVGDKNRPL